MEIEPKNICNVREKEYEMFNDWMNTISKQTASKTDIVKLRDLYDKYQLEHHNKVGFNKFKCFIEIYGYHIIPFCSTLYIVGICLYDKDIKVHDHIKYDREYKGQWLNTKPKYELIYDNNPHKVSGVSGLVKIIGCSKYHAGLLVAAHKNKSDGNNTEYDDKMIAEYPLLTEFKVTK